MKYVVFGLGISGNGAIKLLEKNNLEYIIVDDKKGISSKDAINQINADDVVIKSPGISWENSFLVYCKSKNIKIISEIQFAYAYMNKKTKIIAVTGTNGKTTVVTKIYELLNSLGYKVALGGNEGHSFAEIIEKENDYEIIVLELSSYQLEDIDIKANISLITNLTPDHLLRYDSVEHYYKTKMNIFKNQDETDFAIINKQDREFFKYYNTNKAKQIYMNDYEKFLNFDTKIKGEHNRQNMLNIIAVAKALNIDDENIRQFLMNTEPLEHRMEQFYTKNKLQFINDSKGTNVESTLKAIEAYKNKKLYLICGGEDKKIDNSLLYETIIQNNVFAFLIGENAKQYIEAFNEKGYKNYINFKKLPKVIEYIKENIDTNKEAYVLLSPATSSFDQFSNYEQRGKIFKELVKGNI